MLSWNLPGITQVRCSHSAPELRDPLTDKDSSCKPVAELTEENPDQELKKSQLMNAVAATEPGSVSADLSSANSAAR